MRLSIIDGYSVNPGDLSWEPLRQFGELHVFEKDAPSEEEVIQRIGDAEIVIANKSHVTRRVIDACPNIRFITIQATGYDAIDYRYAAQKGIPVANVPDYGTAAVAQYAISLLLEICGHVDYHAGQVRQGRWGVDDWYFFDRPLIELEGKTMGIVGFGRIGQRVGRIARAMGMEVLAYNRSRSPEGEQIGAYVELEELLRRADVISLHCPLFPETAGMINRQSIAKMKDGVILINNSRGGLVVEEDLAEALNSGKVYAAGLDVSAQEPIREDSPLLKTENCIITPHISWTPKESRGRIVQITCENIRAFLEGKPINIVNNIM